MNDPELRFGFKIFSGRGFGVWMPSLEFRGIAGLDECILYSD